MTGPASPALGAERSVRLIRTLTLVAFLQWMGATAIVPMLPVYIRHLGGTVALAGVVMASFFAAGVLSQYPIGRVADRVGRRPVLIGGLVTYGVASVSFLLPISAPAAIALRSLQGVGAGAATVASLALISSSIAVERRGRAFASIYGGELAGMAIGPLVGSVVGIRYMWVMFLASGLLAFAACAPALRIRDPHQRVVHPTGAAGGRTSATLGRLRMNPSMVGAIIAGSALGLTGGVYDICWTGGHPASRSASRGPSSPCRSWWWPSQAGGWPTTWTGVPWCWQGSGRRPCCARPIRSSTTCRY
jgi:DHA1 family multidrug resistance protein-like MFS transporter